MLQFRWTWTFIREEIRKLFQSSKKNEERHLQWVAETILDEKEKEQLFSPNIPVGCN